MRGAIFALSFTLLLASSKATAEPAAAAASGELDAKKGTPSGKVEKPRRFYFRAGVTHIATLESSRELEFADVDGAASLALENGPIAGSGSEVGSSTVLSAVLGYVLPVAGGKLSIETVIGAPFTIEFRATGSLADESIAPEALGIPTGVPPLGDELGEAKAAPVVLTAVYSLSKLGPVRPFAGGGLSLLFVYDAKITNPILTEVREPEFDIKPAPGLVLQGGAEARIWKSVFARLDVKFIAFTLARAEVKNIAVRTPELPLFEQAEVGTAKMEVWVNPLVISGGVGMDF